MIPITKYSGRLGNQMFQLAYMFAQVERGEIPDIYVQDEKYFTEAKDCIKEMYRVGVEKNDYVVIHVRRGDYVDNPFYVDLATTDYYQKAMAMFPDAAFCVVSDDIAWCKEQPMFKGVRYFSTGTELEDLNLLAGARGVIMANSSFSWWGAYLCEGDVVAPQAWHPDGVERTKLPSSWTRL
jgi:formylmethanofuran dehydrogenase subunit D